MTSPARPAACARFAPRSTSGTRSTSRSSRTDAVRPLFSLILLTVVLGVCTPAWGADDPVNAATKLYEKRRYEQAARMLEGVKDIAPQGQLVLGMIYLRNADLHEVLARTAAAAELDYLDKLLNNSSEGRSRYARLYLAEALLARGNAREAARHFEQVRADPAIESRYQEIASVGLGSVLWARRDLQRARSMWARAGGVEEITLARAAAQGRAQAVDVKSLRRVADGAGNARELPPR